MIPSPPERPRRPAHPLARAVRPGLLALLVAVLTLGLAGPSSAGDPRPEEGAARVLYLNSYHRGYSWGDDVERGLREGLEASGRAIELSVEYLDSRRFGDPVILDALASVMSAKYRAYPLDLVIVSDNAAFDFALRHRERLFPGRPLVFCGYNLFRPAVLAGIADVTGVNEEIDMAATVELALDIQPRTDTLVFITSTGEASSKRIAEVLAAEVMPRYRDRWRLVELQDASLAEIRERLAGLPRETVVFLAGQTRDQGPGRALTPEENGRLISAASPFPVYTFWDFHLNTGVLGGHVLTGADQGRAAADLALQILAGTPVADLPVIMTSPARNIFDDRVLARFGIPQTRLPEGAVVINQPDSAWVRYRWPLAAALVLLILAVSMILVLIRLVRQRDLALGGLTQERALLEDRVQARTADLNQALARAERGAEALREREARLRSYFELPLIGIAITSLEKGWLEVNPGLCALLGYEASELTRMTWPQLTHPDDLNADLALFQRVVAGEIDAYALEKRFLRRDGDIIWTNLSVSCVREPDGRPRYMVALLQDITARKRAEAALGASREQLRFVTDHAPVLIAQCGADGRYRFVNQAYAALFGLDPDRVVGRHPRDLLGEAAYQQVAPRIAAALAGERQEFDQDLPRSSQGPRTVHASYAPQRDAEGRVTGFIAAILDITQRKDAEAALVIAKEQAEAANRAKSLFLANISHEIRTPLNAILGYAQLLERDPGITTAQRDSLTSIKRGGEQLLMLIDGILDMARIEASGGLTPVAPSHRQGPAVDRPRGGVLGLAPGQPVCRVLIVDAQPDHRELLRALLAGLNPRPPVLEFRLAANAREAPALWEAWQPHLVFLETRLPPGPGEEEAARHIKARMAARPAAVRTVIVALVAGPGDDSREQLLAGGCDDLARQPFAAEEVFDILEHRVGLRLLRAPAPPAPLPDLATEELARRLAACPPDWRADLRAAVALGDFERIAALLDRIRERDGALHGMLAKWAHAYDLEAFTRLDGPGDGASPPSPASPRWPPPPGPGSPPRQGSSSEHPTQQDPES